MAKVGNGEEKALYQDDAWVVVHKRSPVGVVGHLQLVSKRHHQGPASMNDAEAASFGDVLRRCERALERATQCSRVYTAALGSPSSGSHMHVHMIPVYDDEKPHEVTASPWDVFLQEHCVASGKKADAAPEAIAAVCEAFVREMSVP